MSLLDDDNEILKAAHDKKKETAKPKAKKRFNSLNKYAKLVDDYKEKNQVEKSVVLETDSNIDKKLKSTKPDEIEIPKKTKKRVIKVADKISLNLKEHIEISEPELESKKETTGEDSHVEKNGVHESTKEVQNRVQESTEESTKEVQNRVHESTEESTPKSTTRVHESTNRYTEQSTEGVRFGVHSQFAPEVRSLTGQNKKLLNIFFEDCKKNGSLITNKFTNELLCSWLEVKPSTLKTLIYRLNKGDYINRFDSKKGRGGWMSFSIPKDVYSQLVDLNKMSNEVFQNMGWSTNKSTVESTERVTTAPSKLIKEDNNFSNLTSLSFSIEDLDWEKLKEVKVFRKQIGDTLRNIDNLYKRNALDRPLLNLEEFQHFIDCFYNFTFSSAFQGVYSTSGLFCKDAIVYQKTGSCQAIEHQKDIDDLAYDEFIAKTKLKKQKRREAEIEAIDLAIPEWAESFTSEEFKKLIPLPSGMSYGSQAHNDLIFNYFEKNIWPGMKSNIRKKTFEEIEKEDHDISNNFEIKDPEF